MTTPEPRAPRETRPSPPYGLEGRQVALVDLLDRILAGGVVISGDLTLSIADIDLVRVSLRALVASVRPGVTAPGAPR